MPYKAVAHRRTDDVAVAVSDLAPGESIEVRVLDDGTAPLSLRVGETIELGHKIALREIPAGHAVTEYGEQIGRATQAIARGTHVHVHNVRSARWSV